MTIHTRQCIDYTAQYTFPEPCRTWPHATRIITSALCVRAVLKMAKRWKLCMMFLAVSLIIFLMITMQGSSSVLNHTLKQETVQEVKAQDNSAQPRRKLWEDSSFKFKPSAMHANTEVRHIGFLKVHKAASSTMQNMFFRFGLKRNLTFIFSQHPNYFSRVSSSHLPLIPPRYRNGYDILCNHGVFNYTIYSSLLPHDTTYIAIVRDPLELFISSVNYYSQPSQAIGYVIKTPRKRIQNLIRYPDRYDRGFFTYTKNTMARDFGFKPSSDETYTYQTLERLGGIFKVVLIKEYFEESLILMKRYLNWKLQDILFIPNNVYRSAGETVGDLTPADVKTFRKRNSLDYDVYSYFWHRFWSQFNKESIDIYQEVLNFKQVLKLVLTFCSQPKSEESTSQILTIDGTDWNEEFQIRIDDCDLMKKDELVFINQLRRIQGSELPRARYGFVRRKRMRRIHS